MTKDEALRLALDALKTSMYPQQKQLQAITVIKAALEAKDEPVCDKDPQGCWSVRCQLGKQCKNTPPQRTWVGLTDEEVTWLCNTAKSHEQTWGMFVRAIETKLRSKNHD